jgi:hypothetical protein
MLPPSDKAEFIEIMKVDIPSDYIFRAATSRPNIQYIESKYKGEEEEAIYCIVQEKLEEFLALGKIIVYSNSITTTKALSEVL